MKILILEDSDERIRKFKENFIGCELIITHSTTKAIELLQEEEFDVIFLDHDLEEAHYLTWQHPAIKHERTGMDVAKFLNANKHVNKDARIIIHSLNPYGSESMLRECEGRDAHRIPFTNLFKGIITI